MFVFFVVEMSEQFEFKILEKNEQQQHTGAVAAVVVVHC